MEFFEEKERTIQCGLTKLKSLGYIRYEDFDGRIRTLRSNLYPDKPIFNTPDPQDSAPLPRKILHPSPIGDFIERDNKGDSKDKKEEERPSGFTPSQARELSLELLGAIKKTKESLKNPNMLLWYAELDRMVRVDKRSPKSIKKVIDWLPSNSFWAKVILSAASLRKNFDRLELELNSCKNNNSNEDYLLWENLSKRTDLINKGKIVIGDNYIEFPELMRTHQEYPHYKIGEPGFQQKVLNCLKKMGISLAS
jgi:hypothetical protein